MYINYEDEYDDYNEFTDDYDNNIPEDDKRDYEYYHWQDEAKVDYWQEF